MPDSKKHVLHISTRDTLRPIRDQVLRLAGYTVDSAPDFQRGLQAYHRQAYDLVLIDVEGENEIAEAERICAEVRTSRHAQLVAFVCNWRVGNVSDCPDEVLRTAFDPAAFVAGVGAMFAS